MPGLRTPISITGTYTPESALVVAASGAAIASPIFVDCVYDSGLGKWLCANEAPNGTYAAGAQQFRLKGSSPPIVAYSQNAATVTAGTATTTPLATPTGLAATVTSASAAGLSWNAVANASSYLVQRATDSAYTVNVTTVYAGSGTSTSDTGLAASTTYYYRILAAGTGAYTNSPYSTSVSATTPAAQPTGTKPKKLIGWGDSIMFLQPAPFQTAFQQMATRLNLSGAGVTSSQIGHPGEAANDFLTNAARKTEFEAAIDSTRDCYAIVNLGTNDVNGFYIETIKTQWHNLITYMKGVGIKGIVWTMVNACKSPFAYSRDANGAIVGTTDATKQAGFDNVRIDLDTNFLYSLISSGELVGVADTRNYPHIYPQAAADNTDYFFAAGTGPYAGQDPGKVHETEYGNKYLGEAWAQAVAPMLGITLNPATVTIPDASTVAPPPAIGTPTTLVNVINTTVSGSTATALDGISQFSAIANSIAKLTDFGTLAWRHGSLAGLTEGCIYGISRTRTAGGGYAELDASVYYDSGNSFNIRSAGGVSVYSTTQDTVNKTVQFVLTAKAGDAANYNCQVQVDGTAIGPVFSVGAGQYMLSSALSARATATGYLDAATTQTAPTPAAIDPTTAIAAYVVEDSRNTSGQWYDASGHGRHLVPFSTAHLELFTTDAQNRPVYQTSADRMSRWTTPSLPNSGGGLSFYMVLDPANQAGNYYIFDCAGTRFILNLNSQSSSYYEYGAFKGPGVSAANTGGPIVIAWVFTPGGTTRVYKNGVLATGNTDYSFDNVPLTSPITFGGPFEGPDLTDAVYYGIKRRFYLFDGADTEQVAQARISRLKYEYGIS